MLSVCVPFHKKTYLVPTIAATGDEMTLSWLLCFAPVTFRVTVIVEHAWKSKNTSMHR